MTTGAVIGALLILLTTWAVVLLQHASGAQPLALEVTAGFDGDYRPGQWLPLRRRIENTGPTVDGELVVALGARRFVVPVSLPAPTKKLLYFEVLADSEPQALTVSLLSASTPLIAVQTKMTALTPRQPLVVLLTD